MMQYSNYISAMTFVLLAVCLIALSEADQDPCVGYETLSEVKRSVLYTAKHSEANICDHNRIDETKWYRFTVLPPSRMHDQCIHELKCGTDRPIWMKGDHPTAKEPGPKTVEVCSSQGGDCCKGWKSTISVKYCRAAAAGEEDFYVYLLKRAPECDMAYCAGNSLVCEGGTIYNPNSKSCTEPFPRITTPVFEGPHTQRKTMKVGGEEYVDFYFVCNVYLNPDPDAATKGQRIEVVFTFDGVDMPSCVPPKIIDGTNFKVNLWSKELKGQCLGKTVSCAVRSYWLNLEKRKSNFFRASDNYFVGLRYIKTNDPGTVINPLVVINGESSLSIDFQSTVPISCPDTDYRTFCKITVKLDYIPDKDRIGVGACDMVFNGLGAGKKVSTLTIQALPTPGIHHRTSVIRFKPIETDRNFFWNGYQAPDVNVYVIDSSKEFCCESSGDPHFRTFNGIVHHNYEQGDFILAKSTEDNFEVHVRQHKCHAVSCNCAVAVREGNNVLGINACDGPNYIPTPIAYSIDIGNPGAITTNNANSYLFSMPSGAYVRVFAYWIAGFGRHLSVFVCVNSERLKETSGMCVTSTGSFRLSPKDSLINAHIYGIKCRDASTAVSNICSCRNGPPIACKAPNVNQNDITQMSVTKFTQNCQKEKEKEKVDDVKPETLRRWRRRRDDGGNETDEDADDEIYVMVITADEFPIPVIDENHGMNVSVGWPTASGVTETEANRRCRSKLETSPVFTVCKNYLSEKDRDEIIRNCVIDLQILDDTDMAVGYIVDSLQKECVGVLENAVITNHTNETTYDPPSEAERILFDVVSKICPKQCNGTGDCRNGTCICKDGSGGEDCSVNIRDPPLLSSIRRGSMCDSRISGCTVALISATNFYRSKNLLCIVTEVDKSREFNYSGSVVSEQEVLCRLPLVHRFTNKSRLAKREKVELESAPFYRWTISLSNDGGKLFSNSLALTVFDSKCQNCSDDGDCVRKVNTCEIEGRCYSAKDRSDHDHDLGCIPSKNQEKWTACAEGDDCMNGNSSRIRHNHMLIAALAVILASIKLL